jgi:hypothetical protein
MQIAPITALILQLFPEEDVFLIRILKVVSALRASLAGTALLCSAIPTLVPILATGMENALPSMAKTNTSATLGGA